MKGFLLPMFPCILLAVLTAGLFLASAVHAAIVTSGDIIPTTAPGSWTDSTEAIIGYNGTGMLSISNGSSVMDDSAVIGYSSGSTGTVTVDGDGSMNICDDIHIIRSHSRSRVAPWIGSCRFSQESDKLRRQG